MNDIKEMLERKARWQKSRKSLSWPEKIHLAERVRDSIARWRAAKGKNARADAKPKDNQK